jgi:predicted Zn-dependent protease
MTQRRRWLTYRVSLATLLVALMSTSMVTGALAESSPLLDAMRAELDRSMEGLTEKGDPPPYFISYYVADTERFTLNVAWGAVTSEQTDRSRSLDVDVRVGDYTLDNTRKLLGDPFAAFMQRLSRNVPLPMEDNPDALRAALWIETDARYKHAVQQLIKVKGNAAVRTATEDKSADFSEERAILDVGQVARAGIDVEEWRTRLQSLSRGFESSAEIYDSWLSLTTEAITKHIVNTEGTMVREPVILLRITLYASSRTDDGMDLFRFESFDAHSAAQLPDDKTMAATIAQMVADLTALRAAPVIEPYTGPAILEGRAAGVFFHEIFGHRIEGHRQKDEDEGQTFTKKIGEPVLPDFISVYDDPTIKEMAKTPLRGYYLHDDEGVASSRVTVVANGVLKSFLMSRSPVEGFAKSNGHGRKQAGHTAVARQGNLIVEASRTVPEQDLKKMLIDECSKQGKNFGLLFKDISGGFTFTGRTSPQAFTVMPIMVYRVYTDGREELVRGADLIGTPLASFSEIKACGDRVEVFNGTCGAESGWVPVSAVAPSVLTAQIEIQKKGKSQDRPPLLPAPTRKGS